MPEISKIKLTSGDEYDIKDTTAREMISSHTHTNESMGFGYGTCDTAASTTAKTVSISNYKLSTGGIVSIKFDYDVPADATLNINSTGDKPIYYNGSGITADIIKAGDTATFIYDGTNYNLIGLNNTANASMGFGFGVNYNTQETTAKTVSISNYKLSTGGIVSIKFFYAVSASATLNISSTGAKPIAHNGSLIKDGIIKKGDTATFIYDGDRYNLIAIDNISNESMGFGFGECSTAQTKTAKTVSMSGYKLTKGGIVSIKFYNDVLSGATLNINSTGAKNIYHDGLSSLNSIIKAGDTATFIYNGDGYYLIATGNISNESMGFGYGACSTAAATTAKTVSIINYKLSTGGIVSIKFNYDVLADTTLNINNTGAKPIYYNGSLITDGIIKAGDTATFIYDGANYRLISLDRDFNPITVDTALSTTSNNPVQNNVIANALNNHTHTNESMGFGYGECNSEEPDIEKTVSISNYKLTNGGIVTIEFRFNVIANATLNINSTGAKSIYYNGSAITDDIIKAGDTATFIYDGTNYNLIATNNITNVSMGFGYGECSTVAPTKAKTVSISNYKLTNGGIVSIKFTNKVTVGSTLNINSTGAKSIYYNGSAITDDIIKAGDTVTFIYDGTNYNLIATNNISNESMGNNITNESMGFGYGTCSSTQASVSNSASITNYNLTNGGIVSIKFNYDVLTNATLNINSKGAKYIYYNGAKITSGIIKAGDTATFIYDGARYNLISISTLISQAKLGQGYATCSIAESTKSKVVSMSDYNITRGGIVSIKFTYGVPANATLSINNTGAGYIYYNGSAITDGIIKAGDTATFIYDGGSNNRYHLISLDRNFDITNESMGFGYGECDTDEPLPDKTVSITNYTLSAGGIVSIEFRFNVIAGSTLNINDTGDKPIYYKKAAIKANIIKARDTATFIYDGTNYNLISIL